MNKCFSLICPNFSPQFTSRMRLSSKSPTPLYEMVRVDQLNPGDYFSPTHLNCPSSKQFWNNNSKSLSVLPKFRVVNVTHATSQRDPEEPLNFVRLDYAGQESQLSSTLFTDHSLIDDPSSGLGFGLPWVLRSHKVD